MGLSGMHILLLVVVILVFFGPSRLPGLGKSVGEAIRGFKKGMDGSDNEIDVTKSAHNNLPPGETQNTTNTTKTAPPGALRLITVTWPAPGDPLAAPGSRTNDRAPAPPRWSAA
ncbi:MAG: twin-arginine translocase TatA/TatE family subunit, partial [Bdellovibrionota bacterium]